MLLLYVYFSQTHSSHSILKAKFKDFSKTSEDCIYDFHYQITQNCTLISISQCLHYYGLNMHIRQFYHERT